MARRVKAAIVIIIDVGYTESISSSEKSDFLRRTRECASMIIQRKIFSSPKDQVGVILMGSEDSNNFLYNGEVFKNISVALPLQESNWEAVRKLEAETRETNISADWMEALVVALNHLKKECKDKKFGESKVVLFTSNFQSESTDNVPLIEADMDELHAEVIVICPEMADGHGKEMAKEIVEQINGSFYDLEQALPQLMSFQKKKVKPTAWNVCLDIGSKIKIPVTGYKKINDNQSPRWTRCYAHEKEVKSFVEREVSYRTQDQTEVKKADCVGGYNYGSTIVPFTEEDKKELNYVSGPKCLSVLFVTKADFTPRQLWMGDSAICFVAQDDEHAATAFSAVVQALDQLKSVAIVRRVYNNGLSPRMGALIPCIKATKEYLLYVQLPFSNDMRPCLLHDLKVENLKEEQLSAVDELIDMMDLSVPVADDESEEGESSSEERVWGELLKPHQILDPYLQHLRKCISYRALNPDKRLPDPDPDTLKAMVEPPPPIQEAVSDVIKQISTLFPNLVSTDSSTGKRNIVNTDKAEIEDAVEGEIARKRMKEDEESIFSTQYVGTVTPLEDFKIAIGQKDVSFSQVCDEMKKVILYLVVVSLGKEDFDKPKESLKLLRDSIIDVQTEKSDAILSYNNWMKELYIQLQEKFKMGFWMMIIQDKLGFITCDECPGSTLTKDEVRKILGEDVSSEQDVLEDGEMDVSDLLDDM